MELKTSNGNSAAAQNQRDARDLFHPRIPADSSKTLQLSGWKKVSITGDKKEGYPSAGLAVS